MLAERTLSSYQRTTLEEPGDKNLFKRIKNKCDQKKLITA